MLSRFLLYNKLLFVLCEIKTEIPKEMKRTRQSSVFSNKDCMTHLDMLNIDCRLLFTFFYDDFSFQSHCLSIACCMIENFFTNSFDIKSQQ